MNNGVSTPNGFLVTKPDGTIVGNCIITEAEMNELAGKKGLFINDLYSAMSDGITAKWWKKNKSNISKNLPELHSHLDRLYYHLDQKESLFMADFEDLISKFKDYIIHNDILEKGSMGNYATWLRQLNKACKGEIIFWIIDGLSASEDPRIRLSIANKHFDDFANTLAPGTMNISNTRSAFRKFVIFIMSYFDGNISVSLFVDELYLAKLVAGTALFASKKVVDDIKQGKLGTNNEKGNDYASWDCMHSRRGKKVNGKRIIQNGIKIDDNTEANKAIKMAVLITHGYKATTERARKMFKNFQACHIWGTPYDEKYYQSIMNLVLVPQALASLTDYNDYVKEVLTYRAYELYGPLPDKNPQPSKPQKYDDIHWRI